MQSDIEQLKREIESLKKVANLKSKNEQRFKRLLECVTDYFYTVQISNGKPISTVHSLGSLAVTGYSSEDYSQNSDLWYQMIYEQDRPSVQKLLTRVFAGEPCSPIEHRIIHKDGSIRWIKHTIVPDIDDSGELVAYDGLINEITQTKITNTINASRLYLIQFADTHSFKDILREILYEAEKLTYSKNSFYIFIEENQEIFTVKNLLSRVDTEFSKPIENDLLYKKYLDNSNSDKPVIHNNNALLTQFANEIIVPIRRYDTIKAILVVGNRSTNYNIFEADSLSSFAEFSWEIAERKKAEEKLLRSDQRLRLHMEQSPLGFIEWDDKFRAIEWNAASERIFGYTREEAIGHHPKDMILRPEQVRDVVDNIFEHLMNQTGGTYSVNENVTKAGRVIICEWFNTTLIDKKGKEVGVVSLVRDITKARSMEVELSEYRDHLQELVRRRTNELEVAKDKAQLYLDIAGVILVALDKNQNISLINQEGCKVLGYEASDIIGKNWFEMFIPENIRQEVAQGFHQMISGQFDYEQYIENPVLTRTGQIRLISWKNVALKNDKGNIIGTLSSGKDITEQKKAEESIINLNKILVDRADALVDANRELESFAYSVSHDLRSPLRHIDGFVELLNKKMGQDFDETSRHYLDEIINSVKLMGMLIDDLLSFSRTSRQPMNFKRVDLKKISQTVIESLSPDIAKRKIEWNIGDFPTVNGDSSLMQIVMTNLISNAVKFTRPREKANIEIGCRSGDDEITIYIRDNGVGFNPEYSDKLFAVFQRLHHTDEFEGTGVGLAIAQRIINRHGGKIWAESQIGNGATFYFTLPKYKTEENNASN